MKKILKEKFFRRGALEVASDLLGKYLVRRLGDQVLALPITEVEAYDGFKDLASHASRGITERNAPMFEGGGVWYVYFVYGMHHMLNIVVGEKDYPAAILIRGVGDISGPARLTSFLKIDKSFNTKGAKRQSDLWIEDRGEDLVPKKILKTARIGVSYAGPVWSKKKYRFLIREN